MEDLPRFVIEREFDAPREHVWNAWTDPEKLAHWYGPGVETVIHKLDVRPGGLWLCEMRWGGNPNYQRIEFKEVVEPERLVWLHCTADAEWNLTASPMNADWPKIIHTTVTLDNSGGKTRLRLTWVPHDASEAEIACFANAGEGMTKGWNAGMDLIAELLTQANDGD